MEAAANESAAIVMSAKEDLAAMATLLSRLTTARSRLLAVAEALETQRDRGQALLLRLQALEAEAGEVLEFGADAREDLCARGDILRSVLKTTPVPASLAPPGGQHLSDFLDEAVWLSALSKVNAGLLHLRGLLARVTHLKESLTSSLGDCSPPAKLPPAPPDQLLMAQHAAYAKVDEAALSIDSLCADSLHADPARAKQRPAKPTDLAAVQASLALMREGARAVKEALGSVRGSVDAHAIHHAGLCAIFLGLEEVALVMDAEAELAGALSAGKEKLDLALAELRALCEWYSGFTTCYDKAHQGWLQGNRAQQELEEEARMMNQVLEAKWEHQRRCMEATVEEVGAFLPWDLREALLAPRPRFKLTTTTHPTAAIATTSAAAVAAAKATSESNASGTIDKEERPPR